MAAAAMGVGGHHDGRHETTAVAHRGGRLQRRRRRNGRQDSGAITMRGIEITVDDGGGKGQRRRNGLQGGRVSVAGQGDGVSPSSRC